MTTIVAMTNRDMYRAAVISQRVQNDFVTGLQVAKLHELKARMRREVVKFAYAFKRIFMDEWGIEFNAIESPIDFSATEWSSSLGNYCAATHTENNKISRRTRDGIRETLLSGRLANKAPRGYKNVHIVDSNGITTAKTIEIDEEKAPLIRAIFHEVAKGVEAPCAIRRSIAPEIPESTFLDILRNIFYKGKIRVPATKTEPEVIVDGLHTPLVTEELFDTVQEIMDGKRKKQPKLTKPIKPEFYLRKYLDGEIDKDAYNRMINRQKQQLKSIEDRRELLETPNRGRVEPQLKYSMSLIDNIDRFFQYAPADAKIRALSSIFSGKLEFDGKIFRTENLNSVIALIYQQTNELRNPKKENGENLSTFPASVPGAGVEPAQG